MEERKEENKIGMTEKEEMREKRDAEALEGNGRERGKERGKEGKVELQCW